MFEFGGTDCLHMPGVAEIHSALIGSSVGSVLEGNHSLTGTQLLFGKVALVLLSLFGSDGRLSIFRCLKRDSNGYFSFLKIRSVVDVPCVRAIEGR